MKKTFIRCGMMACLLATGSIGVAHAGLFDNPFGKVSNPVAASSQVAAPASGVAAASAADPFYTYTGSTPLSSLPLGTVLKQRTVNYHVAGILLPVKVTQLLYRTNNAQKQAVVNVTSVIKSTSLFPNGHAISYQSAYDSLNPQDEPSRVIAGDRSLGGLLYSGESVALAPILAAGYNVIVPDTEGQTADFPVGPEEGMTTLDSIRAVFNSPSIGMTPSSKIALIGYSGGAIATDWAAQLAPTYAPDVNKRLVGAAFGGLLIDPMHNLSYVDGSIVWGGVAPAAMVGLARAYNIDLTPYLNSDGVALFNTIQNQSLIQILPPNLGLHWTTLFKPQYASDLNSIPDVVRMVNNVNAGLIGEPTIPIYFTQGSVGILNGTFNPLPGDGVMLAGDARTLAQQFCASGTSVQYTEPPFEHAATAVVWAAGMLPWIYERFLGIPASDNCALIQSLPGSSLAAETVH
ncbi:MAG: lipase family protein [Collimonas sp.]|uniref:lipase family protein n=1 Tax=Collimonas sp. TaxID=1963772 RepID=UPI0032631298